MVLLKVLFRVRIGPVVVLAAILAAPLFRAVADAAGSTRTRDDHAGVREPGRRRSAARVEEAAAPQVDV